MNGILAIPAASLILVRERSRHCEVLVIERAKSLVFGGGAVVFPGGRIDPDDHVVAERHFPDLPHAAAAIAAIRETLEEAGILVGLRAAGGASAPELRSRLKDGELFSLLLDELGAGVDVDRLASFAHWCPALPEKRRFDTLFFVAEETAAGEPVADSVESVSSYWASPHALLASADEGRIRLMYPTRRNLERLAQFGSFAEIMTHARATPVERISPWLEDWDGDSWLCIPEGLGYPVTRERVSTVTRS